MRRLLAFLAFASVATAQPVPTKDAAAKMKLPPGFKVSLFAGEPDVVQPIAFTFDDRGRMWVVECLMYPKWSQDGKGGKDRVVILEDTDGDGKHDKKTVVLEDGVNLSGIEFGFGGIYLCSSPNLIFIPIKDDKPAGKPEILLDGWNIKDAKHNVFNGLIWGPDGWLYGCNGIQTKSKVGKPGTPDKDRVLFDCGVWRFHPTRKVFEVFATGTTNPWGLDYELHGEMFITNCVIDHLFHVIPGGRYTRMYGQDYGHPHTYGYMGSCVDYKHWGGGHWTESRANQKTGEVKKEHDDAGGGHAHAGCAIYLGENFPKEYRNNLFTANIHGNRLNMDDLERTKTGMQGLRQPDFLFANDPWFRGICVKQGPAGELFVSDWCDTGECHNYDVADTTNGRIYRITYGDLKPWTQDVSKMTDEELVKAVTSQNEWLSRKARRLLQERAAAGRPMKAVSELLRKEMDKSIIVVVHERLRLMWALDLIGDFESVPKDLIESRTDINRAWMVRLQGEHSLRQADKDHDLNKVLLFTPTPTVAVPIQKAIAGHLLQTIAHLKRWPDQTNVDNLIQTALCRGLYTVDTDPDTTLMLWYVADAAGIDLWGLIRTGARQPLLYEFLARKLASVSDNPMATVDAGFKRFSSVPTDECRAAVLRGFAEGLRGAKGVTPSDTWKATFTKYRDTKSADLRKHLDELGLMLGDETVVAFLKERIADAKKPAGERERAVSLLAGRKTAGFDADLRNLLADPTVRAAAIRGLANYADDKTPAVLLEMYGKLTADEKADAVQTLSSRAAYASVLLDAVEKGTVPKGDITAFTARQIAGLKDKAVADKLTKVWGEVKPGTANAKAKIAEYKNKLTAADIARGDAAKGKVLFAKTCGTCHKLFGEGQAVGPELTGSQRANLDYVLENVVDPNAVVPFDYKMAQFYLKDGRQLSGLVKGETPQTVTVRTVNEEVVIAKAEIDERKPTNNSVMPEGLFDTLKPDELRDLLKYLMSKDGK